MATKKKAMKMKMVMVRCYSGVFYGALVARRGTEVDLKNARHIWSWDSTGLPRKAIMVDDIAQIGAGTGTKISGRTTQTLLDVKQIVECTAEAIKRLEALP